MLVVPRSKSPVSRGGSLLRSSRIPLSGCCFLIASTLLALSLAAPLLQAEPVVEGRGSTRSVPSSNGSLSSDKPAANTVAEASVANVTGWPALETAIRAAAATTVEAFNAGDGARIAALFAAEGELIDEDGNIFSGRTEIGGLFGQFFERFPGSVLDMEVTTARPLGDDLAVEEGIRRITMPDGTAAQMVYTAVRMRQGDSWPIVSYREYADDPTPSPAEMLAAIDWLVGEWVDESPEARTSIQYDWSENKNFLVGQYELAIDGRPVGKTTQRIGWDPVAGTLRSWTFDPDGGFSEGLWLSTDDGWVIRSEATMPDGATGVATVTLRIRDADHFSIESRDRIIDGVAEPDFSLVIARKPPLPAAPTGVRPAPAATPHHTTPKQ